nr:hypothetical protein [Tanacetum cinerariifolium]
PPSIEEDDDDSRDTLIREKFLDNYSHPLPENESFHFDIPLSSRPHAKPPDGNTGILNIKMMGDVSDRKPDEDPWKEDSYLGCSSFPFLSPLINSSMGGIRYVKAILTMVMNVRNESCLSMSRNRATFKPLMIMTIHMTFQCQPKNHEYYHKQNSCYDSNSFGFDHGQPLRYTVNHPIFNAYNDLLSSRTTLIEQMTQLTSMCEMFCQIVQKKQEEKRIEEEQTAKAQNWKLPVCYDDDDDEERSNSLQDNIISRLPPCSAITPNEPVNSLSMGDKHLNTILATESDEFIKSCVENLIPNPSETEGENGCDMPACFTTFSNILFEADYESDSSDYQSCSDEDFPKEIFWNPLFEEEIIPMKIDQHHFDAESDLIESMLNPDSSIIPSSSKIDSLLDEFASELTLLKSILSGIDKTDCHPENEICLTKRLLYDNSSPRPLEEFVSENSNANIESFSPSPIPVEDSDSRMEEIDLTFAPDDPMPPSIEEDDYDSERDVLIRDELLDNYSLSLPVIE